MNFFLEKLSVWKMRTLPFGQIAKTAWLHKNMYLDRSSATKRLKRTTREHHLLLVRLHCLWNAHKDIQIQSWAMRTQGMTQQWTFLCIFYSRSTFIQVTWKEELLRFYTWVIIWVRRTSSKKCPQQLFAVPGKQKKQFSAQDYSKPSV